MLRWAFGDGRRFSMLRWSLLPVLRMGPAENGPAALSSRLHRRSAVGIRGIVGTLAGARKHRPATLAQECRAGRRRRRLGDLHGHAVGISLQIDQPADELAPIAYANVVEHAQFPT